ncbi:MAG: response regulator [Myxococcota bacterium]|nr:response regulator [Myxococcota bacterium]
MPGPTDRELYLLFERSPIGMYRSTEDGRFLYANPALARMLGYEDPAELLAINLITHVYADPRERPALIAKYRERGVIDGARAHWRTRDGRALVVQIYGHVVESDEGRASFDASVLDVTSTEAQQLDLQSQREELERTARTLELVVRQMPATYWLVDLDLRILRAGGAIEEILGYAPDRWVGHTLGEVMAVDGGGEGTLNAHARALAGESASYSAEYRGKRLSTVIAPYRRGGAIVGAIGTAIDVTAFHALEHRMVDAQRAESLGVLAGGLAHDFNNLLVAILGNADLGLRESLPGAPGREALENIRHAGLRAAELTDQLLAYAGRRGVSSTSVSPRPLVDELVRISGPTIPANVHITVEIEPELAVRGDAAQIRQVFLNLIANARDALIPDGGSIAIRARPHISIGEPDPDDVVAVGGGGPYLLIEVVDDGPGIEADTRRRIFEPFFTTKATGHGLGLAAVLGIVRAHGGGLRLRSAPGEGSSFGVLWPAAATQIAQEAVVVPGVLRRTVLVIDDEELVRDVVARMVEDLGYIALTAADGVAGLEIVATRTVDAVLVDLTMPRMNGAEVVASLRQTRPLLPIVLCTGYDRDRKGPVQADAYLPKPFRFELLEATLGKLFE